MRSEVLTTFNLKAIALQNELKQAKVNLRGTLLKLG